MASVNFKILLVMLTIFCQHKYSQGLQATIIDCSNRMPYLKQSDGDIEINLTVCRIEGIPVTHHVEKRAINSGILNLSSTSLQDIQDGWFKHFTNLNKLDLSNNSLTELTDKSFEGLTNITQLDLSFNYFVRLKQGLFELLKSLEKLTINNCGIKYFEPAGFGWPDRLFDLSLMNNMIPVVLPLPLATKNDSRWIVHIEGNDFSFNCRRQEHTSVSVNMETFSRIHWKYHSSPMYAQRSKRLWKMYVSSSVCEKLSVLFRTNCDITGICTLKCNANGIIEPDKNIKNTSRNDFKEGLVFKCNRNDINMKLITENHNMRYMLMKYKKYVYLSSALTATLALLMIFLSCYFFCTRKQKKERIQYLEHRYVQRHVNMMGPIYEVIKEIGTSEGKVHENVKNKIVARCHTIRKMESKSTTKEECQESDIVDDVSDVVTVSDVDSFTFSESTSGSYTDTSSSKSSESMYVSSSETSTSPTEEESEEEKVKNYRMNVYEENDSANKDSNCPNNDETNK